MKGSSVTVNDVARSAGVSVGTVSRVLNGANNIAPENLAKVQKAMAELGYQRNGTAGLLASRRSGSSSSTGNIAMVYTEVTASWANHPLVAAYSMGVERAAHAQGFHALIELSSDGALLPRCVRERKVDGLLVKATREIPAFLSELPVGFPVVIVGRSDPSLGVAQVVPDNMGAGWLMAEYLWNCGHRRIAFVSTDSRHPMFIGRLQGLEAFLRERNAWDQRLIALREKPAGLLNEPEGTPPDCTDLINALFGLPEVERPTAIMVANDWMAHGVYAALAGKGIVVGRDISVVGFDNMPMCCETLTPQLTSFDVDLSAVAHSAACLLMDMIAGSRRDQSSSVQLVRGRLVERSSVRPLIPILQSQCNQPLEKS